MKITMKKILFSAFTILSISTYAQSKLSVVAHDSLAFLLTLNGEKVNNIAVVDIALSGVASGTASVLLSVPGKEKISIVQELILKPGGAYFYEVARYKGKYKLQLISESISTPIELPVANSEAVAPANDMAAEPMVIEPMADSTAVSAHLAGCYNIASGEDFEVLKQEVAKINFENKKYETMKEFTEAHCVRVDQLRYMMAQLSLEDNKLKLLKLASTNIYDKARLINASDDFFLEKNKLRAKEIIESAK
jgi:hypothetical protein